MNRFAVVFALALAGCSAPPVDPLREICGNGKDDNNNGLTDCQDPDCAGQAGCPMPMVDAGGNYGACAHCGSAAVKQAECLTVDFQNDTPIPECVGGKCQQLNTNVQVHFELDTSSLTGFSAPLRALNTRVLSKRAVDGSAVTCMTVEAVAIGKTEVDANQIEKSGKFNLRGYDVSPVQASGGQLLRQPFVNIGTGAEFLIWTEVWGGPVGTSTKLPSGNRISWGCFETGPAVAEVVSADNCAGLVDGGVCRTVKVKLINGPQ